ncbi:hypothetical protein BGZ72_006320 [Mortierella alpina]|nr:hypothetical protein BGZ72_006320 [Mortierella alpina]
MAPVAWEPISNKRLRLDTTETSSNAAEAASRSGAIAGGPFSTPHFRMSLKASQCAREQPFEALDYSCSKPALQVQGSDVGFGDNVGFEKLQFQEGDFSRLDRASFQSPAAQFPHKAPVQRRAPSPFPPYEPLPHEPADELPVRALTSRDKIQQIGKQIRRSAAAKITRFGVSTQPPSHTVLDLKRANGTKEHQEHDQDHGSECPTTPTVPGTAVLNTPYRYSWNRRQPQSPAFPVSVDEVSSPFFKSSMTIPTIDTTSDRYSAQNGTGSSSARTGMFLDATLLSHSAAVSHSTLRNTERSWSVNTASTELLQAVEKRTLGLAEL